MIHSRCPQFQYAVVEEFLREAEGIPLLGVLREEGEGEAEEEAEVADYRCLGVVVVEEEEVAAALLEARAVLVVEEGNP